MIRQTTSRSLLHRWWAVPLMASILAAGILVFGATAILAQEITTYNTTLFDTLNPKPDGGGRYSALWGYTAPDGREYAILGGYTGTHIIDITTAPIREVAYIPGPPSGWREMKTYDEYAYVVSEGGDGLQIIDLRDLPTSASLLKTDLSIFNTGHTITQEGEWLYVHGTNVEAGYNQGTVILNVADDPQSPYVVGSYTRGYVHDATIRNDTMYAAMINDGRLDIVHLSPDRETTSLVTEVTYPGAGTHSSDMTGDGRYILTTDEIGSTPKTLKVWDRADVDDIVKVADWTPVDEAIIHNVRVVGTTMYAAWYTAGTRIVDISDPVNPVEVGFYDFYEGNSGRYEGNWEVYPYFASGKIIASGTENGLHVFTFNRSEKGFINGRVRDDVTLQPLAGVVIELPELGRTIITDAEGRFTLAAAVGDVTFIATKRDYLQFQGSFTLMPTGQIVEIMLDPLEMRNVRIRPVDKATDQALPHYAYEVEARGDGGISDDESFLLRIPADSLYVVRVGAWGWRPATIEVPAGFVGELTIPLDRGYADDFELDLGWSTADPEDDGTGGAWERGAPVGQAVQFLDRPESRLEPTEDRTPGGGTEAYFTDIVNAPMESPGFVEVDSGRVSLTSPPFDLRGYVDPWIHVSLFYNNTALYFIQTNDALYAELSNDGGATWEPALAIDNGEGEWIDYRFRVRTIIGPTADMRFRVNVSDSGEQQWVEAGVDDFLIVDSVPAGVDVVAGEDVSSGISVTPHPLRGRATIGFELSTGGDVSVELFTLLGARTLVMPLGVRPIGSHSFPLDPSTLDAGAYIIRLIVDGRAVASRSILILP